MKHGKSFTMKGAAAMKKESKDNEFGFSSAENQNNESFPREKSGMSAKRKAWIYSVRALMTAATGITLTLALFLVVYVLAKGLPNLSFELLTTAPSYLSGRVGILPDILNSLYIVFATLIIVLPLGVGSAVYLTEYARNKKIVSTIEYAAEALSGIPSIIYGLVGMLFFCQFMGLQTSLFAGALTLAIMNLPTVMRATQESLKNRSKQLSRGRICTRSGQMASDSHGCSSGVCGRHSHRLHSIGRQDTGRISRIAVHCRVCACSERVF